MEEEEALLPKEGERVVFSSDEGGGGGGRAESQQARGVSGAWQPHVFHFSHFPLFIDSGRKKYRARVSCTHK